MQAGRIFWVIALCGALIPVASAQSSSAPPGVRSFFVRHCFSCHSNKAKTAGLNLESPITDHAVWEDVLRKIRSGEMPPAPMPRPRPADLAAVSKWIASVPLRPGTQPQKVDPGRVTARRLNRAEYDNTIRDLLAVDYRPARNFPADDSGYGFDNIADVLSLSPVLMEKYFAAAEEISRTVLPGNVPPKPTVERYKREQATAARPGILDIRHRFPADAEYELRVVLGGVRPPRSPEIRMAFLLDGRELQTFGVDPGRGKPRSFSTRLVVRAGERNLRAAFLSDDYNPDEHSLAAKDRHLTIDYIEVRGPYNVRATLTGSQQKLFVCGHAAEHHRPDCVRDNLSDLARRAFRRPVSREEAATLVRFVKLAEEQGDTLEDGLRLALQAILVSPHFLFRIERDPPGGAAHPITDFELASRLSYFLWSSMPDEELFRLAEAGVLKNREVLAIQTRRMLRDPRSKALAENFGGQWLQTRNLESHRPDPGKFPNFDGELRDAMSRETELFFESIVREDRSILDFLAADYTYLNDRLAKHYGIAGIEGNHFRRVDVSGASRGGILTQASVLTVSSYPNRTSPVLRGKWLLENILNAPPPPPPPDVPNLDEKAVGVSGTLRQQLEQHRANPACAVCHAKMDALGFALENFDAVGAWRTHDGSYQIEANGILPGGKVFNGPRELKKILVEDPDPFVQGFVEKMLTYAIGRGLARSDRPAVQAICRKMTEQQYRFSSLVLEIVNSPPFRMRRGEGERQRLRGKSG
ncbi:MAG: DUF1592 domain-containing protein [Bryobacteraceae bacterium]|nr:DUF1592 domain-containing protein [Bryobacterales bacterium]NUN00501.1 DUF1592 domain-containing protein [Bryobacteraceae bacterium]